MKTYYTVGHGCNSSHLNDVAVFDTYKECKAFIETLGQAYKAIRHNDASNGKGFNVKRTVIAVNLQ